MISVMTTAAMIALLILILIPAVIVVYRTHRKVVADGHIPIGHLVALASRDRRRPYGPDTRRIIAELEVLSHRRHDGA